MRTFVLLAALSLVFSAGAARANGHDQDDRDQDECPECRQPTKEACFNLVCHYEFEERHDQDQDQDHQHGHDQDHEKSCSVATTFVKKVTKEGGEVVGDSEGHQSPSMTVSYDGKTIFSNSARLSTDLLGTRIQGQQGPDPAILLPRGALHSGAEGRNGGHYSDSVLELNGKEGFERARGSCFIWTGFPLE